MELCCLQDIPTSILRHRNCCESHCTDQKRCEKIHAYTKPSSTCHHQNIRLIMYILISTRTTVQLYLPIDSNICLLSLLTDTNNSLRYPLRINVFFSCAVFVLLLYVGADPSYPFKYFNILLFRNMIRFRCDMFIYEILLLLGFGSGAVANS